MRSLYKYLSDIFHTLSRQKVSLMMAGETASSLTAPLSRVNTRGQAERSKMSSGHTAKYCAKKYVYVRKAKFIFSALDLEKNIGHYEIAGKWCW